MAHAMAHAFCHGTAASPIIQVVPGLPVDQYAVLVATQMKDCIRVLVMAATPAKTEADVCRALTTVLQRQNLFEHIVADAAHATRAASQFNVPALLRGVREWLGSLESNARYAAVLHNDQLGEARQEVTAVSAARWATIRIRHWEDNIPEDLHDWPGAFGLAVEIPDWRALFLAAGATAGQTTPGEGETLQKRRNPGRSGRGGRGKATAVDGCNALPIDGAAGGAAASLDNATSGATGLQPSAGPGAPADAFAGIQTSVLSERLIRNALESAHPARAIVAALQLVPATTLDESISRVAQMVAAVPNDGTAINLAREIGRPGAFPAARAALHAAFRQADRQIAYTATNAAWGNIVAPVPASEACRVAVERHLKRWHLRQAAAAAQDDPGLLALVAQKRAMVGGIPDDVVVRVVDTPVSVDNFLDYVRCLTPDDDAVPHVVGLDCEFFQQGGPDMLSTIQLAFAHRAYVIVMHKRDAAQAATAGPTAGVSNGLTVTDAERCVSAILDATWAVLVGYDVRADITVLGGTLPGVRARLGRIRDIAPAVGRVGLSNAHLDLAGTGLDKSLAAKYWGKRPLPPDFVSYAALDAVATRTVALRKLGQEQHAVGAIVDWASVDSVMPPRRDDGSV